jgi:predicted CXXCH cytochrome family protein
MEGKAAIELPGRHVYDFRPGDDLSDYIRYYVLADATKSALGAVSQVEAFADSGCRKAAGDRMSCTSCHDPHFSPAENDRVSYYRGKCLACHGATFAEKHHATSPDCTSCHMPRTSSSDVAHTQVTDHHIPRRKNISPQLIEDAIATMKTKPEIKPFPPSAEASKDVRDLALAWESLAQSGMPGTQQEAESELRKAVEKFPNDSALLSALGYVEQEHGANEAARKLYERAFAADPTSLDVATNLGVLEARSGHLSKAVSLWKNAFARAPARSALGMNLASVFCDAGKFDTARSYDLRVLEFNPDMAAAKDLLRYLNHDPPGCKPANR